jgi:hypothetical protein
MWRPKRYESWYVGVEVLSSTLEDAYLDAVGEDGG